MSRDICIYQDFLSDAHRDKIQQTAQAAGLGHPKRWVKV